jgi:hypothetical protein
VRDAIAQTDYLCLTKPKFDIKHPQVGKSKALKLSDTWGCAVLSGCLRANAASLLRDNGSERVTIKSANNILYLLIWLSFFYMFSFKLNSKAASHNTTKDN